MMQIEDLKAYIIKVCKEKMNIELPEKIDETKKIVDAYDLDSISMYELIINLEDHYGFKAEDEQIAMLGNMSTLQLHDFLNEFRVEV